MPVYLAYQTEPEQWTRERLTRIIDDYFDLPGRLKGSDSCFQMIERYFEMHKDHPMMKQMLNKLGDSLFTKCYILTGCGVKNHPTLEIMFRNQDTCSYCPENFTGLNIWSHHAGSEGWVDLIEFKPAMDRYLRELGIDYIDRSKTKLDR